MDGLRSYSFEGIAVAGIAVIINEAMKICNASIDDWKAYSIAGCSVIGGLLLDKMFNGNEDEKLFKMCGLENKNSQMPIVIKQDTKGTQITKVIHMPPGISQHNFESKRQELEQYYDGKIDFSFNKNLVMNIVKNTLKIEYKYVFEECDKPLKVYCGETDKGKFYLDIERCPHILLAGETGGGKSSILDVIILNLIQSHYNVDIHLIDFQSVGLGKYEGCKKVRSYGETPDDFSKLMNDLEEENKRRLALFKSVKNKVYIDKLSTWNSLYPNKAEPYKVVIIDEAAKLAEKQYEDILEQLRTRVSMDRKVGIHFLVSLQRPDVKQIEGSIKANLPTRIAFKTVSAVDSKVILDKEGAEILKNPGRFIAKYLGEYNEVQALYIPSDEIFKYLKKNKLFKTPAEIQRDRYKAEQKSKEECKKYLEEWHRNNPNPYRK